MENNKSKIKELYSDIMSLGGNFPLSEQEFSDNMQDKDFAKMIYGVTSSGGVNLLGAKDEQTFLNTLGYEQTQRETALKRREYLNNITAPTEPVEDISSLTTKEKDYSDGPKYNLFRQPEPNPVAYHTQEKPLAQQVFGVETVIGMETPEDKLNNQIAQLGEDKVNDVATIDSLIADKEKELADFDAVNGDFLREFENKDLQIRTNDPYLSPWNPLTLNIGKKEDKRFVDENYDKFNQLQNQRKAIKNTLETMDTYRQYAEWDRSVAVAERLSGMVSNGEINDYHMEMLRSISDDKERDDYLLSLYNNGKISQETLKDIHDLGDTSDKSGLMYGLFKTGKLKDFATVGLTQMQRNVDIAGLTAKHNRGESLTTDEKQMLAIYDKLNQIKDADRSFGFEAGMGLQRSMQFVLESMLTGGVGAVTGKAGKTVLTTGLKKIAANLGRQMKLTPISPSLYTNFFERMANTSLYKDGDVTASDVVANAWKSYVNVGTERFAESLGGMFANQRLVNKLVANKLTRKIIGNSVDDFSKFIDDTASKETFKNVSNGLTQVGISNIPGEFVEEVVGQTGNVLLTGEGSMSEVFSANFMGQIALQSLLLGGFNSVASYGISKAADGVNFLNNKKEYKKSMQDLANAKFDSPELETLREQLIDALQNDKFIGEDGSIVAGDVFNIMSSINNAYMTNLYDKTKNGGDNKANQKAYETLDKAVRNAALRYGENKAIEAYVQSHIGEFMNKDGNVYEVLHNGKEYFILESTPEGAVTAIEKGTGKKDIFGKDYFANSPMRTTNGTDWATQEFLLNINTWRKQDETSAPETENGEEKVASYIRMNGQQLPVVGYNVQTGKYTITDETGTEVEVDPNDEGVERIYSEQTDESGVESTGETELEYEQNQEEQQPAFIPPKDEYGNIEWSQVPAERIKETLDATFPKEGRALGYIDQRIVDATKRLSSLKKKGAPSSETEYNQYMDEVDVLEDEIRRWNDIKVQYTSTSAENTLQNEELADLEATNEADEEISTEDNTPLKNEENETVEPVATESANQEIDWLSVPQDKFKEVIDSEIGAEDALEYIDMRAKGAKKVLANLKKKTTPTATADFKAHKAAMRKAQAEVDYWTNAAEIYNQPVEEAPVEQTEQVLKNTSDSVLPEGVTPYTVGENIKQKYNDTPKVYGAEDTYTDAEGNTYKGRWVVTEADAVTPSHNAETLQSNEGFPVTDKGRNVNDNDYSNKAGIVETMAANYDARALDEPIIVSEGAIISGNNRTISGQIAAQNGTDTKYKEALPAKAAMRGVSAEELGKFKNPRLVFELAEPIEYTTETFAKFNRPRSKTKSPVDMAIAIGKQDTSRLVGQMLDTIGEVEKFSDLYQNQAKVAAIMKQVVESGIINQNEMPQFYTEEYGITDAGKDFIETLLVGSVINEDQIRILSSEGMKQYREKIASAMIPIAKNMTYEDNFGNELNTAIKYLKEARDAKTNIEGILLDNPMFDKKDYEELAIFTALMLQRKPTEFRQFVTNLNERAELGGENLFGEQENAQSVLDDYKQQNKLSDYEQRTINLAEQARQADVQGVPTSVRGDETDSNTTGERGDGDAVSEGQVESKLVQHYNEDGLLVNEDGSPMVLYHGTTNKDVQSVGDLDVGYRRDDGEKATFNGDGISFTPSKSVALDYANGVESKVFSANIKLRNPYITYGVANMSEAEAVDFTNKLRSEGYDGIIVYPSQSMREIGAFPSEVIVFSNDNIIQESVGNNDITTGLSTGVLNKTSKVSDSELDGIYKKYQNKLNNYNDMYNGFVKQYRIAPKDLVQSKKRLLTEFYKELTSDEFYVLTFNDYKDILSKEGFSDKEIKLIDKLAYNPSGDSKPISGLHYKGKYYFFTENIPTIDDARIILIHERQHKLSMENPQYVEEVKKCADRNELKELVHKMSNSDLYDKNDYDSLANEFLSFAMPYAYTYDNFDEKLEKLGVNKDLINVIKKINYEQGIQEGLSKARRGTGRDVRSDRTISEVDRQDERDSKSQSSRMEKPRFGSYGGSGEGAWDISGTSDRLESKTMQMSWIDERIQELQDQMLPVKKIMDEIVRRGGTIKENSDPYSQEFLSTGRAAAEIEGFMDERYEPLAKATSEAIAVLQDKLGLDTEEANKAIYDYIYARHAPERNKKICCDEVVSYVLSKVEGTNRRLLTKPMLEAISQHISSMYDSKFGKGGTTLSMSGLSYEQKELIRSLDLIARGELNKIATQKDKEGFHVGNNRSGMSDSEAQSIIDRLYNADTKDVFDNISEKIKYCTDFTLDKWLEYGLIDKATYDSYKNLYQHYIPLRGWAEKEDIDYSQVPSNAFNKSADLVNLNRKAGGRWSKADNPIAYIASLAMSASITGNRNLIRQQAFNLITDNLGLIEDIAGMVYSDEEPDFLKNKSEEQKKAHKVPVWIDGQRLEFALAGEMGIKAATAINGSHSNTRNLLSQYVSKGTRFISSSLTAKNVEFLFKNLIRDMGFGGFAYFVENGGKATGELYSKVPTAFMAALRNARGESNDSDVDNLYKEFKENGGQTGYIQMETIDKLGKEFERLANNESKNAARVVFDAIDVAGKASENAMRFAVYMTEREKGATLREAAIRAKEITVNFNRQGLHTKGWSAAYAFFNPAIQGTFRFAQLAKTNPQRFWSTIAAITAAKVALTLLGEALGGGDDETDESTYARISDYVKATNLVIPMDWFGGSSKKGNYMAIPLPQSVRAFTRFGDEFVEVMSGRKKWYNGIWDATMFSIGEFLPVDIDAIDFTADNSIGTILKPFIPTIARPVYEVAINQNFMGNPIRKEPFVKSQDYIPQHKLAFNSTPSILVGTSEFLNRVAGGDDRRSAKYQISENGQVTESGWGSFMDVNPANIDHLAKGYFGGYYNLLIDLMDVAVGATSKDIDVNMNSIPIAGQFYKEVSTKPGYKSFYAMKEEVDNINNQLRNYKNSSDDEEKQQYLNIKRSPNNVKLLKEYKKFSKNIERLNNAKLKADKNQQEEYQDKLDAEYQKAGKFYKEFCKQREKVNR